MRGRGLVVLVTAVVLAAGIGVAAASLLGGGSDAPNASTGTGSATLLAAGDIAECENQGDEATAKILASYPDATIAPLGDLAYQRGSDSDFDRCYGPSWGKFKDRTRPATGNHDHSTKNAQGFSNFFGPRGGPYDKYYYSYDLGSWHAVVLNSDCWRVGGCDADDPQAEWLRRDLEGNSSLCTVAYWHRPRFTSGRYGEPKETDRVDPLWRILTEAGVDVLLVAHDHDYERFAPMNADGQPDATGVREFVVGTGGGNLRPFGNPPLATTAVRDNTTWGILRLNLSPGSYAWKFLPAVGGSFTDAGEGTCH